MAQPTESHRLEIANVINEHFVIGQVFTKRQVRMLCPNGQMDEQWQRRFRELRQMGFIIDTYREDSTLHPNEHRLIQKPVTEELS
jgi:hypothetical protein